MKNHFLTALTGLFISTFLLSSCSTHTVFNDHVKADDLLISQSKTYHWQSMPTLKQPATSNQKRYSNFDILIQQTIDRSLLEKGFQRVKDENADMIIDYRALASTEVIANPDNQNNNFGPQWRFGNGSSPEYQGVTTPAEKTSFYTRGKLDIAVFSPEGKTLWHRSAERLLKEDEPVPERQQLLKKTIKKLMKNFPKSSNTVNEKTKQSRWCFLPWVCN